MRILSFLSVPVVATIALALLLVGSAGQHTLAAGNVVDGLVGPGEYGNSVATDVLVWDYGLDVVSGAATVHYDDDGTNLYVAMEYNSLDVGADGVVEGGDDPVINENVFGPSSYLGSNGTGWPSHKFHQLLGSDVLEMYLACIGDPGASFNWIQDYLNESDPSVWESPSGLQPGDAQFSASGPAPSGVVSASSLEWNLENSSFDLTHGSSDNKDWTSPNFDPAYPTPDAAEAGDFEYAMIYEFSLPLSNLAGCTEVGIGFPTVHNSPTKRDFKETHGQDIQVPLLWIEPTITLDPPSATNTVGEDHSVTATVELLGNLLPDVEVTFTVTDGPNAGAAGTCSANADCTTDASGQVSFTYAGSGGAGIDTIEACFVPQHDAKGVDIEETNLRVELEPICVEATKEWLDPTPTPTPTPSPTPTAVVAAAVEEPAALPDTGGEPSDGGNGSFAWLAAIAAAMAVTASGGLWFAYQRSRAR